MHRYKAFGLNIDSEITLPELANGEPDTEADLTIVLGEVTLPVLSRTRIFRRGIEAGFGRDANDDLILHWAGIGSFRAAGGNELVVSPQSSENSIISLFTVSEPLGLILFQRGYFLIHASAVLVGNEAWCFTGDPGAGKSTTAAAFIKGGGRLLSDDMAAIRFDSAGIAFVLPAYPQLKIWGNTANGLDYDHDSLKPVSEGINKFAYHPSTFLHEDVKLGKIFFLHKARNRKDLQHLEAGKIPTLLIKNFPLPVELLTGEALKKHFIQSFQCARSAGMWQKRRPDGFAALESWVSESISTPTKVLDNE